MAVGSTLETNTVASLFKRKKKKKKKRLRKNSGVCLPRSRC